MYIFFDIYIYILYIYIYYIYIYYILYIYFVLTKKNPLTGGFDAGVWLGVWFGGMIRGASTSVPFKALNHPKKYIPIFQYIDTWVN